MNNNLSNSIKRNLSNRIDDIKLKKKKFNKNKYSSMSFNNHIKNDKFYKQLINI